MGPMLLLLHGRLYERELSAFEESPAWMMAAVFRAPEDLQRRVVSVASLEGLLLGVEIGPPEPLLMVCFAGQDFCRCTI